MLQASSETCGVVELADERAEHAGLLLATLGADVIKVEPAGRQFDARPDIGGVRS